MKTTKKMPSSLSKNGQPSRISEFVIPNPIYKPDDEPAFFGIKTGKPHKLAAISFIGKSITVDDILEKLPNYDGDKKKLKSRLDQFLETLQNFKVGNVISISYTDDGGFSLALEATRPKRKKKGKLP